ncbi:MAG TPA: hypothetical protein VE974_29385 [Thermoanaerobaculia bacterium]|nr:hypothetical protein [Thermoanaerobaculia bacterium]
MKRWSAVAVFVGIVFAFDALSQIVCDPGPGVIALFKDSNYSGRCRFVGSGSYASFNTIEMDNDSISSIRIGPGMQAMLCEHTNYGGTCQVFTAHRANFSGTSIGHDRTSSFKVGPAGVPFTCTPSAQQIAIFQHRNFGGGCAVMPFGHYTHRDRLGLTNDTVSSVQVGSGAEVLLCKDSDYLGDCELFTAARADLRGTRVGEDNASSMQVRQRGTKPCLPGPDEVSIYRHATFEGTCVAKRIGDYPTASTLGIANDAVSSARIGANVQLLACADSEYGTCEVFTQDTPDFAGTIVGNDRLSSMKVLKRGAPECAPPAALQAVLFANFNFVGPCVVKERGDYPNERAIGLANDTIVSLRVGSSAHVCACVHADFKGRCRDFPIDTRDARLFEGGISSVRVLPRTEACAVPTFGNGVSEVAITNCHPSRSMEIWTQDITDGEPDLRNTFVSVHTSVSGGTCSTAFPTRFPLPHGHYLRVAVVDPSGGPNCSLPCILKELREVLGDNRGTVQSLLVP